MEKYVLDTNLFFNMEAGLNLGKKTEEVIINLTKILKTIKKKKAAEFFLPPRVVNEFLSFFEDKNQTLIKNFLSEVTIKSPDINKISFSAPVFYQLIENVRTRNYRGITIGEEEIIKAGKLMINKKELSKKEFEIKIGGVIKNFRERYRQATRLGFLDSLADLDLIVLAKEIDGFLVSSDEGVVGWGRLFGVKETPVCVFGEKMAFFLRHQE